MLALLILLSTFWVGKQLLLLIPMKWYKLELFSVAYLLGTLVLTWSIFVHALLFGYSVGVPLSLIVTSLVSYIVAKKYRADKAHTFTQTLTPTIKLHVTFHLVFWCILLWFLFTTRLFQIKPDGWYSGGTTWADLALHSTLINSFASQTTVDLTSPVYSTQKTTYPFLFDFNTAQLLRTGMTLQDSLVFTSMLASLSFLILCFFLMYRAKKSVFVAQLTSVLFLFNSNSGTYYFFREQAKSGLSILEFLKALPENYVHYPEHELHWAQYITDYLLPQRGILMGLGIFFLVCYFLQQALTEKKKQQRFLICTSALVIGLMPFFHVHTFFVLVGIITWYAGASILSKQTTVSEWVLPASILTLFAAPQLYWQFSQTFDAHFTHFTSGWYAQDESLILFWIRNLGLEFFLAIIGICYLYFDKKASSFFKLLVAPLSILFIICNFVIFQPNDWDNTKFMIYCHFAFTVATVLILNKLRSLHKSFVIVILVFIFTLTAGGALAVLKEFQTNWRSVTTSEVEMATLVRESVPWNAVFLTSDTHNHPIPMLTGRPIVMGYRGWLWTYGIDYKTVESDVYEMYQGSSYSQELLHKYNVSYVYIGERERKEFGANDYFFRQYPAIYQSENTVIYKISP
jgi:hypothetical protein